MLVNFNTLPGSSRLWVYQSSQPLTSDEIQSVIHASKKFLGNWTSHHTELQGGVAFFHEHFLVFAVDDSFNRASGCSIDAQAAFVKQLGDQMGINFFDRMQVAILSDSDTIQLLHVHGLDDLVGEGIITADTTVFNNMVATIDEFHSSWKIPLKDSWMLSFIHKPESV